MQLQSYCLFISPGSIYLSYSDLVRNIASAICSRPPWLNMPRVLIPTFQIRTKILVWVRDCVTSGKPHAGRTAGVGLGNSCFINSVLQCIFHTTLLRGIIVEDSSKLQHHGFYCSYKHHVVFTIINWRKNYWYHRSHKRKPVLSTGYTVETQNSINVLSVSCCSTAAAQRPEM